MGLLEKMRLASLKVSSQFRERSDVKAHKQITNKYSHICSGVYFAAMKSLWKGEGLTKNKSYLSTFDHTLRIKVFKMLFFTLVILIRYYT